MKKLLVILLALLACFSLTACGDASAEVSNKKEVLMKLGDLTITRGDLYKEMVNNDGGDYIAKIALKYIVNKEIADAEEFNEAAQTTIDGYIEKYKTIDDALEELGYNTVEELKEDLVYSEKFQKLLKNYIDENYTALTEKYGPKKIRIMKFTKSSNGDNYAELASSALQEVLGGADFETVAQKYVATDYKALYAETFYTTLSSQDTVIKTMLSTISSPQTAPNVISATDTAYVLQVTVTNTEQLKTEFVETLLEDDDFNTETYAVYLKKYGFTIYDISYFNLFKTNYSDYIVQD